MKCLGMDLGTKTLGLATSDKLGLIASPYKTIRYSSIEELAEEVNSIIDELHVEKLVLGYPKNMNNSEGERVHCTEEFMEKLIARTGLEVVLWDERLSTVSAMDVLKEGGVRRENRKSYVDKIAASLILQGYLDSIREHKEDINVK